MSQCILNLINMGWDVPIIAGFKIAPGPLYYNGSSYEIKDSWNYDGWNSESSVLYETVLFSFEEMGQLFEKADFNVSDGHIDNLLDPLDGWRLPTKTEWEAITTNTSAREGSTVNGSINKHYALIQLIGVSFSVYSYINGLLIFPDGKTIIGKPLSGADNNTQTTGVTESELNVYLSQGCVFLPGVNGSNLPDGTYLTATGFEYEGIFYDFCHGLYIGNNEIQIKDDISFNGDGLNVRLIK